MKINSQGEMSAWTENVEILSQHSFTTTKTSVFFFQKILKGFRCNTFAKSYKTFICGLSSKDKSILTGA